MGDILILGETGAQILVAAELVEHFERSLTQVRLPVAPKHSPYDNAFPWPFPLQSGP